MAKEIKKKEPVVETKSASGPLKFHEHFHHKDRTEEERQALIMRIAKGEIHLQGPDHFIVEIKK